MVIEGTNHTSVQIKPNATHGVVDMTCKTADVTLVVGLPAEAVDEMISALQEARASLPTAENS